MKVVAVYNVKGGVGKTAIALNLAHAAVAAGHRTLLWDLDEQGAASTILGHRINGDRARARRTYRLQDHILGCAWPGLDLVSADRLVHLLDRHDRPRHLRELLEKAGDYDYVLLDCPPTVGLVTEQICELADLIVVPVVPSTLSFNAYEQLKAYVAARDGRRPDLVHVLSMVDRRRRSHRELAEQEQETISIPYAVAIELMAHDGEPVAVASPRSPAVQPIQALWSKLEAHLGGRTGQA